MASQCPQDSSNEAIACLLRLLVDNTQPDWNWDPLNFAVTAAIGVLALVVALITVGQGLLAAGPGRIKASTQAIGPFSIHTRSRFDRTELALRTTARVPLITWDVVYHRIVRQKFKPYIDGSESSAHSIAIGADPYVSKGDGADGKGAPLERSLTHPELTSIGKEKHQYDSTATWLTLLTSLGLDDPQFFPLVQRVTDYLPTDVQAAPAAAELRCLAILAVIADSNATIEMSGPGNRFPRVSADSSQLVFRDHPSLGTVAAYEAYEETAMLKVGGSPALQFGSQFPALKFEDLDRCLQLASGRLAYADGRIPPSPDGQADSRTFLTLIRDLWQRSRGCNHDICEHAYADWVECFDALREQKKAWKVLNKLNEVYMAASLMTADRANVCRGFPKAKMKLQEAVQDLVKLDSFWFEEFTYQKVIRLQKLACLTFWNEKSIPTTRKLSASWVVDFKTVQSTISNPFNDGFKTMQRQQFKEDKSMHIMQAIRSAVVRAVEPNDASAEELSGPQLTSQSIAMMLACLDGWLLKKGGSTASCGMLKLLYNLAREIRVIHTSRQDTEQQTGFWDLPEQDELYKKVNLFGSPSGRIIAQYQLEGISVSTLLVLRGILLALLLDDGADTSLLYEPQFRNSVVRML